MALIRCPGCKRQVSSLAKACALCGTPLAGASPEEARELRKAGKRNSGRLQMQALAAITLFAIGALWLIFTNLRGEAAATGRMLAISLAVIGLVWYLVVRLLLRMRRR